MSAAGLLKLSADVAAHIRAHAAEVYPHECCGALLGRETGAGREVIRAFPLPNRRQDSPHNRFALEPEDVLRAEAAARELGAELVGWYHSHPDHPAEPSAFDREHAWPWYSYLIVAVHQAQPGEMRSWRLAEDRASFASETIQTPPARQTAAGASPPDPVAGEPR